MDNKVLWLSPGALQHNLERIRRPLARGTRILVNLKAHAYGHDALMIGQYLDRKVDYYSVAQAAEGLALKKAGIRTPVMVYQPPLEPQEAFFRAGLEPVLAQPEHIKAYLGYLEAKGLKNYPVHIQLDTGMHRSGLMPGQIPAALELLRSTDSMRPVSVFSHLAAADDPAEDDFTRQQIRLFDRLSAVWEQAFPQMIRHLANTAGIFRFPSAHYDMVRPGISVYGYHTLPPGQAPELRPVASLRTRITQIRPLEAGESVGYNRTYKAPHPVRIGLIPLGYADGIRRRASELGLFVRCGKYRCPLAGRVSMDQMSVVLPSTGIRTGDWAEIFGREPRVETWARKLGTIPYEILTDIHPRVPRQWKDWD